MRLLVLLLLLPVLLGACAIITLTVPLPAPFPERLSDGRNLMAAIVTGVVGMIGLVGVGVYALRLVKGLAGAFEGTFTNAGLHRASSHWNARKYRGKLQGRSATATLTGPYRQEPWRLDVTIAAPLGCRVAFGSTRPLLDCRDARGRTPDDPRLAECVVAADDESHAERLLGAGAFCDALAGLLGDGSALSSWELYIQPERIWARVRSRRMDDAMVSHWLAGLSQLADACEQTCR